MNTQVLITSQFYVCFHCLILKVSSLGNINTTVSLDVVKNRSFLYRTVAFIMLAILVLVIGYIDYVTGFAPDFTILYMVPIVVAALRLGLTSAIGIAAIAVLADLTSLAQTYKHETRFDASLSGFLHLIVFLVVAYIVWRLTRDYYAIRRLEEQVNEDFEIAKTTQRSIFPSEPPTIPGFEVGARVAFLQAVGGDLYDFFALDESQQGFILADISGKSLAAALFSALLRDNWRTSAQMNKNTEQIIVELNRRLLDQLPTDMFVTLFCGIIDSPTGQLEFVNAGHEPGILLIEGQAPRILTTPELMILGISDELTVYSQTVNMPPKSILLLYTDGLVDPPAADFDTQAIIKLVEMTAQKTAQEIVDAIYAKRFATLPPQDDMTILCLKRY